MLSRIFALILFYIASSSSIKAQSVLVNPGVDTTDTDINSVVHFYKSYVNGFKGRELPDFKKYWSKANCEDFKIPDPSVFGIGGDYPTFSMAPAKTIFYVKPLPDSIFLLKSTGGWIDSLKSYNVLYQSNHYIRKTESDGLRFITPYEYYRKQWDVNKLRNITFYHPKALKFNSASAESLISKIKKLETDWKLKPIMIKYFYSSTYDEIQLIRGFDYTMGMGNADKPSGISNQTDNIVYCAGSGEDYFHEVVHIYLNPIHKNSPLNEGLAVFYGGSMGNSLNWHIKRLQNYLVKNPNINLGKLDEFYFMDNYTNPNSTILGLLCQLAYGKDKINGLKRIMTYNSLKEILLDEFNISPEYQNEGLRRLILTYNVTDVHQ